MLIKKFTKNLLFKLCSLLVAVILWLVVMNIEDPINVKTYNNINIIVKNDDIIKNKGKKYYIVNNVDKKIKVTVEARRSVLKKIKSSDIVAVANFHNLIFDNLVPIELFIPYYEGDYKSIISNQRNLNIIVAHL